MCLKVCSSTGCENFHSTEVKKFEERYFREDKKDSKDKTIKKKTDTVERTDPIEEIVFQTPKKSGKSEYRRGIPLNPKKCCGKKVILTPTNIK